MENGKDVKRKLKANIQKKSPGFANELRYNRPKISAHCSWFYCVHRLQQRVVCGFDQLLVFLVNSADTVGLVQIAMKAFVIH